MFLIGRHEVKTASLSGEEHVNGFGKGSEEPLDKVINGNPLFTKFALALQDIDHVFARMPRVNSESVRRSLRCPVELS